MFVALATLVPCLPVQEEGRRITGVDGWVTSYSARVTEDGREIRSGEYLVVDAEGQERVSGQYVDGKPAETWRWRYADGELAVKGKFDEDGSRTGSWTFHHAERRAAREGALRRRAPGRELEVLDRGRRARRGQLG